MNKGSLYEIKNCTDTKNDRSPINRAKLFIGSVLWRGGSLWWSFLIGWTSSNWTLWLDFITDKTRAWWEILWCYWLTSCHLSESHKSCFYRGIQGFSNYVDPMESFSVKKFNRPDLIYEHNQIIQILGTCTIILKKCELFIIELYNHRTQTSYTVNI